MELISKIANKINVLAKYLVGLFVAVISIIMGLEVFFRYFLGFSLFWVDELSRYLFIWIIFIGASIALKENYLTTITFFTDKFSKKLQIYIKLTSYLIISFFLVLILYYGIYFTIFSRSQISPALNIPMSIPYLAIPIGSLLMILHTIILIYNLITSLQIKENYE